MMNLAALLNRELPEIHTSRTAEQRNATLKRARQERTGKAEMRRIEMIGLIRSGKTWEQLVDHFDVSATTIWRDAKIMSKASQITKAEHLAFIKPMRYHAMYPPKMRPWMKKLHDDILALIGKQEMSQQQICDRFGICRATFDRLIHRMLDEHTASIVNSWPRKYKANKGKA